MARDGHLSAIRDHRHGGGLMFFAFSVCRIGPAEYDAAVLLRL
jgi:hypothetical protein